MSHSTGEVSELDRLVEEELAVRRSRVEWLGTGAFFTLFGAALWLAWPLVTDPANPDLSVLAPTLLVLLWAFAVQDATTLTATRRARVGAAAAIGWPPIAMLGMWMLDGVTAKVAGLVIMLGVSAGLLLTSRSMLSGQEDAIRFRGLMTGVGMLLALSALFGASPDAVPLFGSLIVLSAAAVVAWFDWWFGDTQRLERRRFRRRLEALEVRLLELRAEGAAVDQAASLVKLASDAGWRAPDIGMELLDEAEHDIERQQRMSADVKAIREDARLKLEEAEAVAPETTRPRRAYDQGLREQDLGSLRDAELLYRRCKTLSLEIVAWWGPMQEAIAEAEALAAAAAATGSDTLLQNLVDEAIQLRDREQPEEATKVARTVLTQSDAVGALAEEAGVRVDEARAVLESSTDGLDDTVWMERFEQANRALACGDHSQAKGLADSITREVAAEREAMEQVRRAMRQRKKLDARFAGWPDEDTWKARLDAVEEGADARRWRHTSGRLATITSELDELVGRRTEAEELLEFMQEEWSQLRGRLEAAGVGVEDEDRRACEVTMAQAAAALGEMRLDATLRSLGDADTRMEALRRRV